MERFSESDCSACGLPVPVDLMPDGDLVRYADAQATVEALQAQLKTARYDAVRAFVRGEDKMCLVCGAKEPCELKDDPSSPCTFDPTPMELKQQVEALQRERDVLRRQVDTQRRTIQRYQASHDEHTQLQALARALPVVGGDIELDIYGYVWAGRVEVCKFDNTGDAKSYADLLAYRATLDATTPAEAT